MDNNTQLQQLYAKLRKENPNIDNEIHFGQDGRVYFISDNPEKDLDNMILLDKYGF